MRTQRVDRLHADNPSMLGRVREWIALSVLAMAALTIPGAASSDTPRSWLEPCPLIVSAASEDLELQRRRVEILKLDTYPFPNSGSPIVRLLVEPSFAPDWVVSLYHAENSDCRAVAVLAEENVYYANYHESHRMFVMRHRPASIATTVYQEKIPCDLADKVKKAWHAIISAAKRREAGDPIVVDGTEYTASSFFPGVGPVCGYSHSPLDGSPAAQLVELGDRLLEFVQGNDAERVVLKTNIGVLADELLALAPQPESAP